MASNNQRKESAHIVYVSGGCRSGKSSYAQRLAEALPGRRLYLATGVVTDDEMGQRIEAHQRRRQDRHWETLEEPLYLGTALAGAGDYDVILVDCLTLWLNNLLYDAQQKEKLLTEEEIVQCCNEVISHCRKQRQTIIFVTSELGMGMVPVAALSRSYRDLLGRCNQIMAEHAHEAFFLVSGLPLRLK